MVHTYEILQEGVPPPQVNLEIFRQDCGQSIKSLQWSFLWWEENSQGECKPKVLFPQESIQVWNRFLKCLFWTAQNSRSMLCLHSMSTWILNCFCSSWHGLQDRPGYEWLRGVRCEWKNLILIEKQSQINNWAHWSGLGCLFFESIRNTLLPPKRTQKTFEYFPKSKSAPSSFHEARSYLKFQWSSGRVLNSKTMNRRYPFDLYHLTTFEDKKKLRPRTILEF